MSDRLNRLLISTLAVLCTVPATQPLPTTQDPPPALFRSTTSAVMVDVSVRNSARRAITGLTTDDFEVLDNGVPQKIDQVTYGMQPIDVTVALDVSKSVSGAVLDRLRRGVGDLLRDLANDERLKLVLFNMQVVRVIDFTRDVNAIEPAVRSSVGGGGTALLDAMSVALLSRSPLERRQLLVVFTDGSDSSSTTSPEMITRIAQRSRATVTFVMPGTTVPQPMTLATDGRGVLSQINPTVLPQGPLHDLLSRLARETGGRIIPLGSSDDLSATFRRVLAEFRAAYVLYFTPSNVDRRGYHTIDVRVKRRDAIIQARRGYFAE